jgi:hypothetical protein
MPALIPVAGVCIRLDDGAHGGKFAPWRRNPETPQMSDATPDATVVALNRPGRSAVPFELRPDAGDRRRWPPRLASTRCASCASPARWSPRARATGGWRPELGATVVQPCVVTLAPVTTRIDTGRAPLPRRLAGARGPKKPRCPRTTRPRRCPSARPVGRHGRGAGAGPARLSPRARTRRWRPGNSRPPASTPMTDEDAKPLPGLPRCAPGWTGRRGGPGGSGG